MKRNCNLELRLVTHSSDYYNSMSDDHREEKQPLTIFYNGRVASSDTTELQARTIIFLASKEMEGKSNNWAGTSPCSEVLNSPIYSPTTHLSMKRSLQRFLEKRKNRAQSMSPYSIISRR
ncbi:hypothetical protein CASFOL_014467 [Castilleja foliolosa]|uniref:Protein TIFY n=1 Tax=Castilleja foliolosa TaxID=1961234 RepID=A0ABD3DQL9_9LAMI